MGVSTSMRLATDVFAFAPATDDLQGSPNRAPNISDTECAWHLIWMCRL